MPYQEKSLYASQDFHFGLPFLSNCGLKRFPFFSDDLPIAEPGEARKVVPVAWYGRGRALGGARFRPDTSWIGKGYVSQGDFFSLEAATVETAPYGRPLSPALRTVFESCFEDECQQAIIAEHEIYKYLSRLILLIEADDSETKVLPEPSLELLKDRYNRCDSLAAVLAGRSWLFERILLNLPQEKERVSIDLLKLTGEQTNVQAIRELSRLAPKQQLAWVTGQLREQICLLRDEYQTICQQNHCQLPKLNGFDLDSRFRSDLWQLIRKLPYFAMIYSSGHYEPEFEEVVLTDLLSDAIAGLKESVESVELVSGLENRKVLVCPTAIALALGEMMLNADKYGQDVEVKIIIHDCEIVISVVSIGPIVCSSRIGLIGRRGVRGENVNGKPGSGQGLALVKELAESMGGKFEFTSIPTRENGPIGWTTVTCILPVSVV